MDLATIIGLTLAVLGAIIVVLGVIGVLVLGPAVRRALAERRAEDHAAAELDAAGAPDSSAQGAEHGDGGGR